jgi:hypothetical protein
MTSNATMNCCLAIASAAQLKSGGVDGIVDYFERELQLSDNWLKVSRKSAISYNKNRRLQPGNPAHDKFQQCLDSLPDEANLGLVLHWTHKANILGIYRDGLDPCKLRNPYPVCFCTSSTCYRSP